MDMEQTPSNFTERRKYPRISTKNLIDYILFNEHRKKVDQGKGLVLDLSQSGALMETQRPLYGSFLLLITIDLDGEKIKVKGRVANVRTSNNAGFYLTGVEFIGPQDEQLNVIVAFVKAYHRRKHFNQKIKNSAQDQ
jgi:hypothetical protein